MRRRRGVSAAPGTRVQQPRLSPELHERTRRPGSLSPHMHPAVSPIAYFLAFLCNCTYMRGLACLGKQLWKDRASETLGDSESGCLLGARTRKPVGANGLPAAVEGNRTGKLRLDFLLPCLDELALGKGECGSPLVFNKEVEVGAQTQGIYQSWPS